MAEIRLLKGRERSLERFHPWIYSGAVAKVTGDPAEGDTVAVTDSEGRFLAYAAYAPASSIRARVWSFWEDEAIDEEFFARKIEQARRLRLEVFGGKLPDAYRLVNAESDSLPGMTIDVYGPFAVCQFTSAGAEKWRRETAAILMEKYAFHGVYERSDADVRKKEGLELRTGLLCGQEPPEEIIFTENGVKYGADVRNGHKTGFYLDQRMSRLATSQSAAGKKCVLNCFCYTGGFGLAALMGGAEKVINVDSSADALAFAERNAERNGFTKENFETVETDVFKYLRSCRDAGKSFDMIVLDPPKFAESAAMKDRAARGYKDINLLAMKLLQPGGRLLTFSCSGAMDEELFGKVVDSAAADAKADFRIVRRLSQGPDHPVSSSFPEGHYLKGIDGVKVR